MTLARRALSGSLAAVLVVALGGCGDGPPPVETSTAEAKVTGTVTVNGKPMTSGTITLDASNYRGKTGAARTGEIKSDGTYEVKTFVGKNQVRVNGPEITKNPELGYANETIDVAEGGTTHNIVLPPPNTLKSK